MGNWISIDLKCKNCEHEILGEIVARGEETNAHFCPVCGEPAMHKAFLSAPGITNHSYVDGAKRQGFQDLKEANKLEILATRLPGNKRKEINKEIARLQRIKK